MKQTPPAWSECTNGSVRTALARRGGHLSEHHLGRPGGGHDARWVDVAERRG